MRQPCPESVRILCVLFAAALALPAVGQDEVGMVIQGAFESAPVTPFVFEGDLRDLAPVPAWKPGDPIKEIPRRFYPPPGTEGAYADRSQPIVDPLLALQQSAAGMTSHAFTAPSRNFPGQGFTGVNPPDTVGTVGPNHYLQMINTGGGTDVRVWDKALPVPNVLTTFRLDNLGSGACANGLGDPIALYDRLADRFVLSEFSASGNNLCVFVSRTPSPVTGGWFNYQFTVPSFPDYPKYGVWPTDKNGGAGSYVVTANDGGPGVFALNRGAMLAGTAATFQRLSIPPLPGFGFQSPTPADLDGPTPPPATAPAIILRHRDTENHSGPTAPGDLLEMWSFAVDWLSSSNTTLVKQPNIDVAEFDSSLCGLTSFNCFPQPGTGTTLDPLREVVMNRLQYINHGTHQTLVGNLVTDVDGANHGGVRWFELRGGQGAWTRYQEGTYAPDAAHRWMAASAMDQSGNIALAYSVSSTSVFPSLRYTGRLDADALGVLTQPEISIHAGSASNSSNRWGDYADMSLDPSDNCTFWFTSMDNVTSSWRTQVASFTFDACGCALAPSTLSASASIAGPNAIDVSWNDADLAAVVEYSVGRSFTAGGPYATIATVADTSPGVAGGAGYVFTDTDVSGGTTYHYIVTATDGVACTSDDSNEASATATGACTLDPLFAGLASAQTPFSSVCTVDLAWDAAAPRCGGPVTYNVYRSILAGFTPGPVTLIAAGVPSTAYSDLNVLTSGVPYYYVVRALDSGNGVEEQNTVELVATPEGELTLGTWTDNAGDSGAAKLVPESPWQISASEGHFGPKVYKTGNYGDNTCAKLTTPELLLGSGPTLTFWSHYDIENSWDKGVVQISTDGVNWQRVTLAYPGTSTNTADACGLPTGTYFTGANQTAWVQYTANLAAWSNQNARIRFEISSDTSATGSGWWIDDISITQVGVPAVCATGSACADNPFVNVLPDGPVQACAIGSQLLTVQTSGGSGPFDYEWTRDGVPIHGAHGATYEAQDSGTHVYNCRVRAESCVDPVFDGVSTQVAWVGAPTFGGLLTAGDGKEPTCTIDLSWSPASSPCPGPFRYLVYRSTTSPVAIVPQNLVASGLTGTTYSDSHGLIQNQLYRYVVRAVDLSTGVAETNVVERQGRAIASGPGIGASPCESGVIAAAPSPVPDGSVATTPLRASRVTPSGDLVQVTWDATSCPSASYNLIYGDLAGVGSYALDGADCAIGTSGAHAWSAVPAGSLYFLIVGTDGDGVESSWGASSSGERNGLGASGECGTFLKNLSESCP